MADKKSNRKTNLPINSARIRYSDYARTLLSEGLRIGKIKSGDCTKFCASLSNELCRILRSYYDIRATDRDTIGADATELLRSTLFTVDTYLISLGDHEKAMKKLKSVTPEVLRAMCEAGRRELRTLQFEALSLCFKAGHDFTGDRLPLYTAAVKRCRTMILEYDREYMTHIVTEEPPYPTAVPFSPHGGIKYIRRYLRELTYENNFCLSFEKETREAFFDALCRTHGGEGNTPEGNVYRYFLVGALICAVLHKDEGSLLLTVDDCKTLYKLVHDREETEIYDLLLSCASTLRRGNGEYNSSVLEHLVPQLISAMQEENIERVAVVA